jgi:putative ABC transport system substrate-binding protein
VNRRTFLGTVGWGLIVAPPTAGAQQPAHVPRIGYLGLAPVSAAASRLAALRQTFSTMSRQGAAGLLIVASPRSATHRTLLAELALKHRLPAMVGTKAEVQAGELMSYGADFDDLFRRSAGYIDKILKGTKPADLPVEQPTKYELVINLKTAKALGLAIPPSLLLRADQVLG